MNAKLQVSQRKRHLDENVVRDIEERNGEESV